MEYSEFPSTKISGSGRFTVPGIGMFKVSGSGKISPEEIATSGSSKIPGGLKVGDVRTSGSSHIEGDIETDTCKFSGSARVEGTLSCNDLSKSGSLSIEKELNIKYGRVSGSTKVHGSGNIERELESSGAISFGEDLNSEGHIKFSGVIRVEGKATSRTFEGRLNRDESFIRGGIEADNIDIQLSRDDWHARGILVTSDIVGNDVVLENVECDNITGGKITIFPGCRVKGKIQYRESVKVDPSVTLENEPEKIE
jgi:cytoskeletal protein CcmA (bactofilin family)